MTASRRARAMAIVLVILALLTLGCQDVIDSGKKMWGLEPPAPPTDMFGNEVSAQPSEVQGEPAPEGTDETITFAFAGEGLAYHMGLLTGTRFHIDYETGKVTASESKPFEEPAGIQTRKGTDSVTFTGSYNAADKTISGDLVVRTNGVSSGGETADSPMEYVMNGRLEASFNGASWDGTVRGKSMLTQSWEDGSMPAEETPGVASWTITSVTRAVK